MNMADASSDATQENEEAKKKSILEEKSKEDLVKIVKKQLTLLQKAKGKSDELSKKCQILEEEKKLSLEKQELTIIGLQQQLESLELNISKITEANDQASEKKESEVIKLNDRIKSLEIEKSTYVATLNEKEERMQCLSMQMNTFKETCQCLQAELLKLQQNNNELKNEITVLTEARDSTLESLKEKNSALDFKIKECVDLVDQTSDLKKKYSICIEENCLLASKIENLEEEMKNLKVENSNLKKQMADTEVVKYEVDDFSILINDNQKLKSENDILKKEISSLRAEPSYDSSKSIASTKKGLESQEILQIRKENFELQQHLCDVEGMNSKLKIAQNSLEEENHRLSKKVKLLEDDNLKRNTEMESVLKEKIELKEEVKRLTSSLQEFTEFKTGYEHALLHGANTESLTLAAGLENEQTFEEKQTLSTTEHDANDRVHKLSEKLEPCFEIYSAESGCGLEFGLLSGGDINEFYDYNVADASTKSISYHSVDNLAESNLLLDENSEMYAADEYLKLSQTDLLCAYEKIKLEKDNLVDELGVMRIRVDEYANLLQETLSENESLKLELENHQKEMQHQKENLEVIAQFSDSSTNTELELIEKRFHDEALIAIEAQYQKSVSSLEDQILSLKQNVQLLEVEKSTYSEENATLFNKIDSLNDHIKKISNTVQELKVSNENAAIHSSTLEKQNLELSEKLAKKCTEQDEFNFQLELLVISIKQGVRQKSSATANKAEKQLHENMNLLRTLLDDLILRCNDSTMKVKSLKNNLTDLLILKQSAEEELFQMKELNQFLEDEARELRGEVEQFKVNQTTFNEQLNENYFEKQRMKSPNELYSIEEIDEKLISTEVSSEIVSSKMSPTANDFNVNLNENHLTKLSIKTTKNVPSKTDISIQVNILSQKVMDESIDNTLPFQRTLECETRATYDSLKDAERDGEFTLIIEQLKDENARLKGSLKDKSILVERIHCEMDSLLEKVEVSNLELQEKTDDLKHCQHVIEDLQSRICELGDISNSKRSVLKYVKNVLNELRNERDNLKSEFSSLNIFSNEVLTTIKNSLINTVDQCVKNVETLNERCLHTDNIIRYSKSQLNRLIKDVDMWSNTLEQMNNMEENIESFPSLKDQVNLLRKTHQELDLNYIFPENKCDYDCCLLINDLKQLESAELKLFGIIHNDFYNSRQSILKEVDEYKTHIIPNLESTIKNLEDKLIRYKKDTTEDNLLEKRVEKCEEESSNTDLKQKLADTEVKMTKCKQIALKLKKELNESKKQYDEIRFEKDKCVSQLSEARKELEKVSSEQFHHAQNYQSLQNEYDKIQDELEIEKEKVKKLEADLSTTLMELNSSKEKVSDMDSQLLKSNQILEACVLSRQEKEKVLADLESKIIVLESKAQERDNKVKELEENIKEKLEKISNLVEENNNLKGHLECSQKVENKKNLLDLEMADYERSIFELNNKILKKEDEIKELKLKLNSEMEKNEGLLEEIKSTETLKETEEKRASHFKELLNTTKSELSSTRERESELLTKVSCLQMQLEIVIQQEENCKLQLSETSAEIQHLKEMIKTSSENNRRIVQTLESKVSSQKQEILCAHKEVENIKQEFDNYKIRVHSVLKQQKSSVPAFTSIDDDAKEKLEAMVDKLKMQVKHLSDKLSAMSLEYEALQEEHDNLLQRHNKAIEDREKNDSEWHTKLEQINVEKNKLRAAQEELSSQHLLQNEMLVSTYKKQIKIMSDEHKRTVNELQKQLESADLEIARMQRDQQKIHGLPLTPAVQENPLQFDILSQERQEGEGSESIDGSDTPIRHMSLATIPTSGFLPFEKLLQSTHDEFGYPTNYISNQDYDKILGDLNASNKKIEHLSEVLNESESTNLRLSEQVRVLKEEVRRLERNKEREQHAENLEYLKNVFIKFATLSACSEKAMLIPVLTTMLKLSPDEQQQLKSIAGDIDVNDSSVVGWGSYLHRWSGLA